MSTLSGFTGGSLSRSKNPSGAFSGFGPIPRSFGPATPFYSGAALASVLTERRIEFAASAASSIRNAHNTYYSLSSWALRNSPTTDYRQLQYDAANAFLRGEPLSALLGGTSCTDSSQCSSGYACISGRCTNQPPQKEGCESGQTYCAIPSNCGKATPGARCISSDCCGDRCCRFSVSGVVCFCGKCSTRPVRGCNAFCDAYNKTNGEGAAGGGCSGGGCDECSSCGENGKCEPSGEGPCWCTDTKDWPFCQACTNGGSFALAERCVPCREYTVCGKGTGRYICRFDVFSLKEFNGEPIDKPCLPEDDPCVPVTTCGNVQTAVREGAFSQEDLEEAVGGNTFLGYIQDDSEGGSTTYLYQECNTTEKDASCKCRCNDDCNAGEKCDSITGTCVADTTYPPSP